MTHARGASVTRSTVRGHLPRRASCARCRASVSEMREVRASTQSTTAARQRSTPSTNRTPNAIAKTNGMKG